MLGLVILCGSVAVLMGFGFWTKGRNVRNARTALGYAMAFAFAALVMSATTVFAAEAPEAASAASNGLGLMGAALSTGLACIGAGIGVAFVGAAALGVVGEKPALFGTTLIYMGLAEGIAIYGLVISLFILGRV
ncbi:ATPase [Synergistales bacterium]|nr:ATPase [Synergistales bacterium]